MPAPDMNSQFASVVGLGAFQSEHRPSSTSRILNLLVAIGLILAGPILILVSTYMAWDAYGHYGLNKVMDSGFILPLIFAVILTPLGLWQSFTTLRGWNLAAALYEGGFAYMDRKGMNQVRWADIEWITQNVTKYYRYGRNTRTTYIYTIQLNDKTRIVLDNKYPRIEALGRAIANGSANTLFPRYMQALKSGERLGFGPLAIDVKGLYHGSKALTWQEIKAVKIARGIISVRKEGGWFNWASVTVPQIPNFYIFVDLVGRFAKLE
jgi:hypothetical protein